MIEVKNVWKTFDGNEVLRDLSLTIDKGETIAIVGSSGCGKTVLLKHILGLLEPDRGEILVDGVNISRDSAHLFEVRKKFGMVFQSSALFDSLNVIENVIIGLREHFPDMGRDKMELIGKEKLALVGLDESSFSKKPQEISGGMKKRVAIARAISLDPEYIIYDEPTTGLDPIMCEKMNELMLHLKEKLEKTTIMVTHDLNSAFRVTDRVAMLADGEIVFDGSPREALKTKNNYMNMFIKSSSLRV
ncbi:ATP-binding cassette domain-containing protein [candidate division WOR-3 bacterium]|nr:ATP-binding cassette domain-containing protein [candidate division WOR-3 bacterium]